MRTDKNDKKPTKKNPKQTMRKRIFFWENETKTIKMKIYFNIDRY